MKETKNNVLTMEQKIYTVLIAGGILALIGVSLWYGLQSQKAKDVVEQKIEIGDENPVSGQVSDVELDVPENVESTTEETKEPVKETAVVEKPLFTAYDGRSLLEWPVDGAILIPYSMDTTVYFETLDQYQCNPAIYMEAETGTEVKSVSEGQVKQVREDQRYGQMVAVDMGNGYKAWYGQLSDVAVKEGQILNKGTVLGKVAEPTAYFMLEGSHLYMKMTKDGKEVNPTDYFTP